MNSKNDMLFKYYSVIISFIIIIICGMINYNIYNNTSCGSNVNCKPTGWWTSINNKLRSQMKGDNKRIVIINHPILYSKMERKTN